MFKIVENTKIYVLIACICFMIDKEIETQLHLDIDIACDVWRSILEDHGVIYAYAKGSAVKKWESKLDYVPYLSDLDIHLMTEEKFFSNDLERNVEKALEMTKRYENTYYQENPDNLHIPRPQLMPMHKLETLEFYVPPQYNTLRWLLGSENDVERHLEILDHKIKEFDRTNLLGEKEILQSFPYSLFDRVDLDYWQFLRRICWRVSPAPTRLISQYVDDSHTLWSQNRTTIYNLLIENNFDSISKPFKRYYELGWQLFDKNFRSDNLYREMIFAAFQVIHNSITEIEKLEE